jgi:hypothetical protein
VAETRGRDTLADVVGLFIGSDGRDDVQRALRQIEQAGFHLLRDVDTSAGPVEHVAIGPTGAFTLHSRMWKGSIGSYERGRLQCSPRELSRTLRRASRHARDIQRRLEMSGIRVGVEPILLLGRAQLPSPVRVRDVTLLRPSDLCGHVRARRAALTLPEQIRGRTAILAGPPLATIHFIGQR